MPVNARYSLIALIALTALALLARMIFEARRAVKNRAAIAHIVHVNGTRGKSTVARLIGAGLRAGGYAVLTKTTGTDPMYIDVSGRELPVKRRSPANIREQLAFLRRAAAEGANAVVIECMAVDPALQRESARMLQADVGVITNVRLDHTDVMGETREKIADALSEMIPPNGTLVTGERDLLSRLAQNARAKNCRVIEAAPDADCARLPGFPENTAVALAVCELLGVPRETALAGMRAYTPDPYEVSLHRVNGALFVNALSANDPDSTLRLWEHVASRLPPGNGRRILLVNGRNDRAFRSRDMLDVARQWKPNEIWLTGGSTGPLQRALKKRGLTVHRYARAEDLPLFSQMAGDILFAVGNIAGEGRAIVKLVRERGEALVR